MKYKRLIIILLSLSYVFLSFIGCQNEPPNENTKPKKRAKKIKIKEQVKDNSPIITAVPDYTYDDMKIQINKLNKRYERISLSSIGKSVKERDLFLLTLGSGEKKIAVVSGVHGRENMTSLLTLKLLEDYSKHLDNNKNIGEYNLKDLLNKVTFYFIPMLNPDGMEIAVNGITDGDNKDFYIKANEDSTNFERWKANARGVDLNKQFQADWQAVDSKKEPHFDSYKGPAPESEPESKALAKLTRKNKFDAVVAFHHSGSVIYWYYNQENEAYDKDYNLAKRLSATNGYKLVEPDKSDTKAAGYKDWFIKEFKKPGFTIEIGDEQIEGPLPANKLDEYFMENRRVLLELARGI